MCRGKVSEGLDFPNWAARAVIIVGIPYAFIKDPKVEEKRKFMDENKSGGISG